MVFGWVFAGHQIGAASAAFGAGLVRTEYSTYLPAFFVAGALCLIAAALVLTVRKQSAEGTGTVAPGARLKSFALTDSLAHPIYTFTLRGLTHFAPRNTFAYDCTTIVRLTSRYRLS